MSSTFSPIQNHIMSKLKNAKSLRYSELVPEYKVQNDLFNYHLQFLVKKGFVDRLGDEGYALSEVGIKHVADPIVADSKIITSLFKSNVITIVSRVVDGKIEILNQIRKSNPSYGKVGVMGGVIWKGENTLTAASRKLTQETGLEAEFRLVGIERRIMYVQDELFSDLFFPIAYSDTVTGGELQSTEFGENMWVSIDQAIKNESNPFDSIAMITTVLKAIQNGTIDTMPFEYQEVVKKGEVQP